MPGYLAVNKMPIKSGDTGATSCCMGFTPALMAL
jgi:hypothetical protein